LPFAFSLFPSLPLPISVRPELVEGLSFLFYSTMSFWAYMLHCDDRSFYVGHTDNLEQRIAAHEQGLGGAHTATRLPIALVWSQEFGSRDEALEAERKLKGWSRAKKLALIRGDWTMISALARSRQEK
jgi:predicted GIY-YIG superfamily endonuclease